MTAAGWAVLGAILLASLQFFAIALVQRFDEDPPRPPRQLKAPSNVTRTRREEPQ